jgi:hypothetical protein
METNNRETTITFYANSDDNITWERAYWDKNTENEINQFTVNQFSESPVIYIIANNTVAYFELTMAGWKVRTVEKGDHFVSKSNEGQGNQAKLELSICKGNKIKIWSRQCVDKRTNKPKEFYIEL